MPDIKYFEEGGKLYKQDSDGEKYRISFSEELQLKNLKAARENKKLLELNLYAKIAIAALLVVLTAVIIFIFYRLDTINFFTGVLYR
ncbi:MAG TPA: hypothetical protein VJH95_01790 [Candidatus Nanoarchaeia archaeon]|nr:hypothetical protein [Candidatus Nanoarchaeia archaeon]